MSDENLMDKIVSDVCANIINQKGVNKRIELVEFNPKDYGHLLYLECALIVANYQDTNIYISLPLFQYIKLKFKYKKVRKRIKKEKAEAQTGKDTIDEILDYVCTYHQVNDSFLEKIYKEYYEVKKNGV